MLYPILLKKILFRIRTVYEDFVVNKSETRDFEKYEGWLREYLDLDEEDRKNILLKFERSQTSTIIFAMKKKDKYIFVNQLGAFYIKATTIDFYNALARLTEGLSKDEYDINVVRQNALEETRTRFIQRRKLYKNGYTYKPEDKSQVSS